MKANSLSWRWLVPDELEIQGTTTEWLVIHPVVKESRPSTIPVLHYSMSARVSKRTSSPR